MVIEIFNYFIGSDASAIFFISKKKELNAEKIYAKLTTTVFEKGVACDVPNAVREFMK